jgi:hypothetical protein
MEAERTRPVNIAGAISQREYCANHSPLFYTFHPNLDGDYSLFSDGTLYFGYAP